MKLVIEYLQLVIDKDQKYVDIQITEGCYI